MGNSKRSLVGHLTLTAWESWSAEPHWRNTVIIAVVGAIAFGISKPSSPPMSQSSTGTQSVSQQQPLPSMPNSMNSNATILTPTSKAPLKLKPKLLTDNVIIEKTEKIDPNKNFGRSYGEK